MKLVVLYEELSEYFLVCLNRFQEKYNAEVYIICKKLNKEAPFIFSLFNNIFIDDRDNFSTGDLVSKINQIAPDILFCGGWSYKPYLLVAKRLKNSIPTILAFDNKWNNSLKQKILSVIFRKYFKKRFSSCWVPGRRQKKFAEKLGFPENDIYVNAYSADVDRFYIAYQNFISNKKKQYPKRFIYFGRYIASKGINDLWKAFIEIQNETPNEWELWCFGAGEIQPIIHPKIKHFGFIQSRDIEKYLSNASVFILPSHFEPWGVAVHEFASAGFPLLLSDEIGASEDFLKDGINGFVFQSGNISELKERIQKITSLTNEELFIMGESSIGFSKKNTPDIWANTLFSIYSNYKSNG